MALVVLASDHVVKDVGLPVSTSSAAGDIAVGMRRKLRGMGLLAALLLAVAALLGTAGPASAATGPYGFTILHADSHQRVDDCEVLGPAQRGYVERVCVFIATGTTPRNYYATAGISAACQTIAGDDVPCQGAYLHGILASGLGVSGYQTAWNTCGSMGGGPCSSLYGENLISGTYTFTGGHNCTNSIGHDVWAEAFGDTELISPLGSQRYVWPSGANDGLNYSTGHYWICP